MEKKEILTTKELAKYLNIHPFTLHKLAREGKIPAFKIGTDWRFHKHYIDRWIKQKLSVIGKKTSESKFKEGFL
jgi:excisionase family DNA binding protein